MGEGNVAVTRVNNTIAIACSGANGIIGYYELKLEDVASEVALAPTYFSRLFKAEKGINFKVYLNNMRFEYAKKLLEHTDMTVLQICTECGFNDYPNFIRRFKQHTGYYPVQYRELFG